jgi:DNA invertase Pin-like site-specific DNA recombinase
MSETKYTAGLYLRLSKDDERAGESVSIENQRLLLTKYAEERGWEIREIYIDDGWSGTTMQRPAFRRMMHDAEEKRINLIIVKDLSRLGRNYIEVGRLTEETLPMLGCRFVALNDSVDSLIGDNDMMVYRNLFNEFYSKDTSKKVRAVKQACMRQGKFLGSCAPFGYKKDPSDKHSLIIDEETAHIVRRIFRMRCAGQSYRGIALAFNGEHVVSPRDLHYRRLGRENPRHGNNLWNDSTIKAIVRSEVYLGHMVQGKYGTASYKNRKLLNKPREQWVRVENTHEPIIGADEWETARMLDEKGYKPRTAARGERSMFVGILKCGDCGFNMRAHYNRGTHKDGSEYSHTSFICGNYGRSGKAACSAHIIGESVLTELVLGTIREHAALADCDEKRITADILRAKNRESEGMLASLKSDFKAAESRLAHLDNVIKTLYEDRVAGVVTEGVFKNLMQKYERERESKSENMPVLKERIARIEKEHCDVGAWPAVIRKHGKLEGLSAETLLELVDVIEVFEPQKINGRRVCRINIVYRFVGNISEAVSGAAETEAYDGKAV